MTLRTRLILFSCGTTMAMVVLTLFFGGRNIHHEMESGIDFLLDAEAEEIEAILKAKGADKNSSLVHSAIHDHALLDAEVYYFSIHEPGGKIVYESPNIQETETHLPDLGTGRHKRTIHTPQLGELRLAEYPLGNLHIQIAKSMRELNQIQSQFNRTLALTLPVVFIVILIISLGTSGFVLKPIQDIRKTAQRITAHNLNERIPEPSGRDELASLTHLLNEMFDRLEHSFRQIKRFTADTSHELRTPLSLLRLHAEKLHAATDLPLALQENAEELLAEVNRMTEVVERLLILTKVDAGIVDLKTTRIDIEEFVQELFEDAQALAESKGVSIDLRNLDAGIVEVDATCIRQVFFNLLSNAFAHGTDKGAITIDSSNHNGLWILTVEDNGPGVTKAQLEHIFERFTRMGERGDDLSGAGLGLAISKSLVELHRGTISAENLEGGSGFRVAVSLPTELFVM